MTFQAKKRNRMVKGHFTPLPASLFASTGWQALSATALRLFGFMAGADSDVHSGDGRFGFTYEDFVDRGIHRHAIAPALRELEEAGIIKRVLKGHGGEKANNSSMSFYRLTTYAADGPQAFLEPLTREEWLIRLAKARAAKDMKHACNVNQKSESYGFLKPPVTLNDTGPVTLNDTPLAGASDVERHATTKPPVTLNDTISNNPSIISASEQMESDPVRQPANPGAPSGSSPASRTELWLERAYGGDEALSAARAHIFSSAPIPLEGRTGESPPSGLAPDRVSAVLGKYPGQS